MLTTHNKTLTKMEITVRQGGVDIDHPSGVRQILTGKDIAALHQEELEELGRIEASLRVYEGYMRDI